MSSIAMSVHCTDQHAFCPPLKRGMSGFGRAAVAELDHQGVNLRLRSDTSEGGRPMEALHRAALRIPSVPGAVIGSCEVPVRADRGPGWRGFEIRFEGGAVDRVAVCMEPDREAALPLLPAVWPLVREDCLRQFGCADQGAGDALLWTICHRVGAAVLVLDDRGEVLRTNQAAADMLACGVPLQVGPSGLCAADASDTRAVRRGMRECLATDDPATEIIVVIADPEGEGRLPLSLTRFAGPTASLIVVTVPRRPDPRRIERLAQDLGLTPAEARVASLLRLGLPNREAAFVAGLKEQTYNTYAKRVLAKLDAGCRAEVAQRLTWQAGLGAAS